MAFAAGHKHDLFVSYDHEEEPWVDAFLRKLVEEFANRTGETLSLWQDTENLRVSQNWSSEIEEAIGKAAAFLAVVSPRYLRSIPCSRERMAFLKEGLDARKEGSFYRFIKIIKTFDPDSPRPKLLPQLHEMLFCDQLSGKELREGSPEFADRIQACFRQIRELLRFMNNQKHAIYLAHGHEDIDRERERLKSELKDHGFRIEPEIRLDPAFDEDDTRKAMEHTSLAVFLFAEGYEEFTVAQVGVAQELGKPVLFWVREGRRHDELLWRLDEIRDQLGRDEIVVGRSTQELTQHLVDKLRPANDLEKVEATPGTAVVYVNYDFTDPMESRTVQDITKVVLANRFEVAQSSSQTEHDELMRTSNAVLVFRAANPEQDEWLKLNALELLIPARALQRHAEFDAKALLVSEPGRIQARVPGVPVYSYSEPFDPATLAPFLDRIQRPYSHHARH